MGKTGIKNMDNWQERMCRLYERVRPWACPHSVNLLCSLKAKKGELGFREQWEDGECDKEQWGETEDSYVLWMRSSGWLWRRSLTPPSAPHATPLSPHSSSQQMMHNGFLCSNGPDSHTGSFLPVHIAACTQVLSVKKAQRIAVNFLHSVFTTWLIMWPGCTTL